MFCYLLALGTTYTSFAVLPIPGESEQCMTANHIITELLRNIYHHTNEFERLPQALQPSVELLKRYRDSEICNSITVREVSPGQTKLDIVSPALANAYFNLAQFGIVSNTEQTTYGEGEYVGVIEEEPNDQRECIKKISPSEYIDNKLLRVASFTEAAGSESVYVTERQHTRPVELSRSDFYASILCCKSKFRLLLYNWWRTYEVDDQG